MKSQDLDGIHELIMDMSVENGYFSMHG